MEFFPGDAVEKCGNPLEMHNRHYFRSEEFADIQLQAFGKTYRLHRFCLVRSPFFHRMFTGEWSESAANKVSLDSECNLQGLTKDGLELALEFLYTAKLEPKFLDDFCEALLVLKFLLMDAAVEELLKKLDRSLEVKDYYRVSHTAVICCESIKGLWDLTLAVLAYDPCLVMDHARDIHRDVLVGLISHPGLRIRKDLARYALAEHILKNVSDGGRAKRPRRSDTPEVSVGSPGSPSDALDFGTKLFLTLPEWNITENDIKMIRERGLVPNNLIVDWFLHPLRKYFVNDTLGFDITICDGEVVSTVPDSWRRLGNERIDPRPTLQATSRHCVTRMLDLPNNEPPVCFVATDYGVPDLPLSLACHLKLDERIGRPAANLLEGCSLRLHTSKGTSSDATIFRHAVMGQGGKDLVLGHVDAPRNGHVFVVLKVPRCWGIGSYTRTTRTSIMEDYHAAYE